MKLKLSALVLTLAGALLLPSTVVAQEMAQDPNLIPMHGNVFQPAEKTVAAGTTVTWVNWDAEVHNVLAYSGAFASDLEMPTGAVFSFTFADPGSYRYACDLHVGMEGVIVVAPAA